jgi:hypothetical protein
LFWDFFLALQHGGPPPTYRELLLLLGGGRIEVGKDSFRKSLMAVSRMETSAVFLLFAIVIGGVGWAVYSTRAANEARNTPARAAGFIDADDMERARSTGFTSAIDWRAEVQRRAEVDRIARAQAEAKTAQAKQAADATAAKYKAEEDARKRVRESQFQEGIIYARVLKKNMKNPDSFKLEQVIRTSEGIYCYEYRATNSFNAIVPGHAFVGNGKSGSSDGGPGFTALWNKYCGRSGEDFGTITYAINNGY